MSPLATGWQSDGTYLPCPACRWEPPTERLRPGAAYHFPGTTHHGDCPTIPRLSPAQQRELQAKLDEMDRVRRRGAAKARSYVIG